MNQFVKVEIPVEEAVAEALNDPGRRELVGQLVSRMLRPRKNGDPLAILLRQIKDEAHAAGLTDEAVDAELAAYNAERRT